MTGLKTGEIYTLRETVAPDGYSIATDTTFILDQNGKIDTANTTTTVSEEGVLLVEDQLSGPKTAAIKVTKELKLDDELISAVDQTFYVRLYEDAECTKPVSDIKPIVFKNASAATVEFTDLEVGKIYYISETDSEGKSIEVGALADETVFMSFFPNGNEAIVTEENGITTVIFENQFYDMPDGFFYEGNLNVTKKVVGADGAAKNTDEVFYAGVFDDPEYTIPSEQVVYNLLELDMNGESSATASTKIAIPSKDAVVTLYVTEVDKNGNPIAGTEGFKYEVSQDKTTVTVNAENTTANVVITNKEKTTVTSTPTPTPTPDIVNKKGAKTGDDTPIGLYLALLAVSFVCITSAGYRRRRKNNK